MGIGGPQLRTNSITSPHFAWREQRQESSATVQPLGRLAAALETQPAAFFEVDALSTRTSASRRLELLERRAIRPDYDLFGHGDLLGVAGGDLSGGCDLAGAQHGFTGARLGLEGEALGQRDDEAVTEVLLRKRAIAEHEECVSRGLEEAAMLIGRK